MCSFKVIIMLFFIQGILYSQIVIPTDAKFGEQWYLYHQGVPENQRADKRCPEAWFYSQGDPNLKIAIIESISNSDPDAGIVNSSHPDLINRVINHCSSSLGTHANQVAGVLIANSNNDPIDGGIVGVNWHSLLNAYYYEHPDQLVCFITF